MRIARRSARAALAALTAAAATVAVVGLTTLAPASASTPRAGAQDITLKLTPSSGSNYGTDKATLSWTDMSACVGQEVDSFIYLGSSPWNAAAINKAEGNSGAQLTYFNFGTSIKPTTTTGSSSWPNVAGGYIPFGTQATPYYNTTAQLVNGPVPAGLGNGIYTIALACVNATTFQPILDGSGNPIAGTLTLNIGATGSSWAVDNAVTTTTTLSGSGTAPPLGSSVSLTAHVTATNGTVPVGGVNFYVTGKTTPLNGSTPVKVGSNGMAAFSGPSGVPSMIKGPESYTAKFVPANPANYTPSAATATIYLIFENATITVTWTQDPTTPNAIDMKATATGSPVALLTADPHGGVDFLIDGAQKAPGGHSPFPFNSSAVATGTIPHVKFGSHALSADLANQGDAPQNKFDGWSVTVNTIKMTLASYASATAVSVAETSHGLQVTAKVTGKTPSGQKVTLPAKGKVTVKDGSATLGTATVAGKAGSGVATGTVTGYSLPAGKNVFTATFTASNTNFGASTGTTTLTVPTAVKWVTPGKPHIHGTAKVGKTLSVILGTWSPSGVKFTYQWFANGTKLSGQTHATLKLASSTKGKTITVDVTGSHSGFRSVDVMTPATAKVAG